MTKLVAATSEETEPSIKSPVDTTGVGLQMMWKIGYVLFQHSMMLHHFHITSLA
jgi:hypothetical protein